MRNSYSGVLEIGQLLPILGWVFCSVTFPHLQKVDNTCVTELLSDFGSDWR